MFLVEIDGSMSLTVSELIIIMSGGAGGKVFKLSSQNHKFHKWSFFPSVFRFQLISHLHF